MDIEGDVSTYETAHKLSLPKSTLENWVRAYAAGRLWTSGATTPLPEVEKGHDTVKRELSQVKQERYILKKAAVSSEMIAAPIRPLKNPGKAAEPFLHPPAETLA
jgi:transposase-like protein